MTAKVADPKARTFLRKADPVLGELIDARPDFRPRAWMDELPPLDSFGTLVFQVAGQQLSVSSTRAIIRRLQERFGGHMPSPAELARDPAVAAADTILLTVPNQLGVDYNAHLLESILKYVAPQLGWR